MPRKVPLPKLGPSPTPITEYLAKHPDVSLMSLAKAVGLHYITMVAAERGQTPPGFVTMLRLQTVVGIPVMAWAGTKAVQLHMEKQYWTDPQQYNDKQNTYRRKRMMRDPVYAEKQKAKDRRSGARRAARKRGEVVPDLPMSPMKAALLGLAP